MVAVVVVQDTQVLLVQVAQVVAVMVHLVALLDREQLISAVAVAVAVDLRQYVAQAVQA
jgi:hypothetical protein